MTMESGTVLNNIYRVVKLPGKGSTGNVYLVEKYEKNKTLILQGFRFKGKSLKAYLMTFIRKIVQIY